MTIRTTDKTITFRRPFCLKGVDRVLPPGDYRVVTDEELIEGLSLRHTTGSRPSSLCRHRPEPGSKWWPSILWTLRLRRTKMLPCTNCAWSTEWHRWVLGLSRQNVCHGT